MEDKPISGQVAVVTGASSGIGTAICEKLAKAGARVVMGARRTDKLEELKTKIAQDGGEAAFKKTDVTIRQEVQDLVKFAETTFGPVDIFVNNAGYLAFILMKNLQLEEWDRMVNVNCMGMLNGIAAVIDSMVKRKSGHFVVISSESGRKTNPAASLYAGTKFFCEGVCRGLRQEVSAYNIKVTSIQPGLVDTAMLKYGFSDPEATETFCDIPFGDIKILDPVDIAEAVIYAVTQPSHVAVNELLIDPRGMPVTY